MQVCFVYHIFNQQTHKAYYPDETNIRLRSILNIYLPSDLAYQVEKCDLLTKEIIVAQRTVSNIHSITEVNKLFL